MTLGLALLLRERACVWLADVDTEGDIVRLGVPDLLSVSDTEGVPEALALELLLGDVDCDWLAVGDRDGESVRVGVPELLSVSDWVMLELPDKEGVPEPLRLALPLGDRERDWLAVDDRDGESVRLGVPELLFVSDCVPDGLPESEGVADPLRLALLLGDKDRVWLAVED